MLLRNAPILANNVSLWLYLTEVLCSSCTDIVTSKANRTLGLIHKVFECKDSDIIIKLYKSLVQPLLEYNNVIWGQKYAMDKQKVEAIQ